MHVTILLFARLHDLAGVEKLVRDIPQNATVETVWQQLVTEHPTMAEYETTVSVAVNANHSRMHAEVRDGDEVAFLPPVSGG